MLNTEQAIGRMDRRKRDELRAYVKRHLSFRSLYVDLVGPLRGSGNVHCPNRSQHGKGDNKPTLQVFDDGAVCYGGSCEFAPDVFELWQHTQGGTYEQSLAQLAERTTGAMAMVGECAPMGRKPTVYPRAAPSPPRDTRETPEQHAARLDVMRAIWTIVEPLPLTANAKEWLSRERKIDPSTAHALGCRDWFPARSQIWEALKAFDGDQLRAAGFNKQHGTEGEDDLQWSPLRRLDDDRVQGLAVPCWAPGDDAPITWRWRYYDPDKAAGGEANGLKCRAMYGKPYPIGLVVPENPLFFEGASSAPVVVITEGEPDMMATHDCLVAGVGVVGIVGTGEVDHAASLIGWKSEYTQHIAHAERVIVMVHEGVGTLARRPESTTAWANGLTAGEAIARSVFSELARVHGRDEAGRRFTRSLLPDKPNKTDANNLHEVGRLHGFLTSRLGL